MKTNQVHSGGSGARPDSARATADSWVAVVIPCFRVSRSILGVIAAISEECHRIYVVDDSCPERTGEVVEARVRDSRVRVLRHHSNQGVGGAVITGYRAALAEGATVIVKIDGDGQMDPRLIGRFVSPIVAGDADYTKGNRFYTIESLRKMPRVRLVGNAILSILSKFSTGYWTLVDPTNGFTAIHARVAAYIPLDRVSKSYFFETDMLFRLNTVRAVVVDVPMDATYTGEFSSLRVSDVAWEFLCKHLRNSVKRIFYSHFLRDFSIASIELVVGIPLLLFGLIFGITAWVESAQTDVAASTGTVVLAALSIVIGLQFLMSFLNHDIASVPRRVIHALLPDP